MQPRRVGVTNAEEILKDYELKTEKKRSEARKEIYSVLSRCTNSEASTIARSATGLDGLEVRANDGKYIQGATCVHVPKASRRRESGEAGEHAPGREVESRDV